QPNDAIDRRMNQIVDNERNLNGVFSANWQATKRLGVRPSVLYQFNEDRRYVIAGSEFHMGYGAGKAKDALTNTVFAGLWYRTGNVASITAGAEIGRFRACLGYDYNLATLDQSSEGNGGFEVAVR